MEYAANREWLQEQFGDMVISADLHLDELTPHIHALIAHEPNGIRSFKKVFGGSRNTLRDLQQGYADSMSHLGIERGEMKNEHATHTQLAEHSRLAKAKLSDAPRLFPKPNFPRPAKNPLSQWINEDQANAWRAYDCWRAMKIDHIEGIIRTEN